MAHSAGGNQAAGQRHPASVWFGGNTNQQGGTHLLFCLPLAGGGASMYTSWQRAMGPGIGVLPVQLPGRETRITEPVSHSPGDIAAAIAARADRPYAIYGHSMGARLAFEVVRSLARMGARLPERFYPAAARPPHAPEPLAYVTQLSDEAFLDALAERLDAPDDLRHEPALRELLMPILRADFEWLASYRLGPGPPIAVPFVAIAGVGDPEPPPHEMRGWAQYTTGSFRLHTVPGGHFFVRTATREVAELIRNDLLA